MDDNQSKTFIASNRRIILTNSKMRHPLLDQVERLVEAHRLGQFLTKESMKVKNGFLMENLDLKGWKATSTDLKENGLFIELRNRKKDISRLIFFGVIAFRDEGVIGKPLSGLSLDDQGSFKRLFLRNPKKEILFFAECMEAKYESSHPKGS